jgi:hypothetical protein
MYYDENKALAEMLTADMLILNEYWFKDHWPEDARRSFVIAVNCNDVFAGGADAEEVMYDELENLYDHYKADITWGVAVWCCKKRKCKPGMRYESYIKVSPAWSIE